MFEDICISPEEFSAYGLQSIVDKHMEKFEQRIYGVEKLWVCDEDRDIRLFYVKTEMRGGPSGRDEPTGICIFVVFLNGKPFEVRLKNAGAEGLHLGSQKMVRYWRLERISDFNGIAVTDEFFQEILQEALSVWEKRRRPDVADTRAVLI